jgi:hypothetical protein
MRRVLGGDETQHLRAKPHLGVRSLQDMVGRLSKRKNEVGPATGVRLQVSKGG